MICLSLIRQALDPSFPAFKTEKGWGFLHHSQVLSLVYCQDFTIVLLVWPSLASPRRTDLTLGRGVTDAQLSASFSLLVSLFMHHRFICFNEKPRAKLQVFVFFFLETTLQNVSRYSLWKLGRLQKHVKKI